MRLWSYQLIPVLPNKMLVSQWRECLAIKRQWEKGTLKHRLVSYVMSYDKSYFKEYVSRVCDEMLHRNINFNLDLYDEIRIWAIGNNFNFIHDDNLIYSELNNRYLKQCLYNLQEKYDRGIITKEEWQLIYDNFKEYLD